ncbi:MAG: serpin family protein [Acidimicrobiia bacterium]|nr:serpin family protein [Acidimicrobiia bacterium]
MRHITPLLLVLALLAAACGDDTPNASGAEGIAASDLAREVSTAPDADLAAVSAAEQAFAAELYRVLAADEGNLVVSPLSIHVALAMALGGAAGDTAAEMTEALEVAGIDPGALHGALNALDAALESRNRIEPPIDGREQQVQISVVNSLWGQDGFAFVQEYLDLLARNYGAGIRLVDFRQAAEEARVAINAWVAEETNDRITDLIPAGAIDDLTRLVLVNAVYLDATWALPFDPEATFDAPFFLLDGSEVSAPTMHAYQLHALYASGEGWQAIDLPYTGEELSMIVVVPDAGRFTEVEGRLTVGLLDEVRTGLGQSIVDLSLPKFEMRNQLSLVEALQALGISAAFDPGAADFSGMSTEEQLFISGVLHEAFIAVDEAGTEAAAATAVIIGTTSMPTDVVALDIDRPFLFFLQDRVTGALLFVGRVVDPTA